MNDVGKNRMALRVEYSRSNNEMFSDNIHKYADWLEINLANKKCLIDKLINRFKSKKGHLKSLIKSCKIDEVRFSYQKQIEGCEREIEYLCNLFNIKNGDSI